MFTCMLPFAEIHVMEHGLYVLEAAIFKVVVA